MNFPYSKKALLSLSLAAAVMVTSGTAWAVANGTPAAQTTAPAPAAADTSKPAAAPQELTIAKAVEQALQTNSQLRSLRIDVDSADVNARLVNAKVKDIPSDFIDSLDLATTKYVNSAKAESAKKVNEQFLRTTESKIKLGAQQAYYNLLHAQSDLELKKQSLKRAETQLKVAKAAFDVGTRAKTEVLQAEAGLARAQAALAVSQSNVEVARMKLNEFLGVDIDNQWILKDEDRNAASAVMSLDEARALALKQRPEIVQREEEIKVAELNLEMIQKYSSVATYQGELTKNSVEKAKIDLEDEKRAIEVEVAEAYYKLQSAKTAIDAYKKAKDAATENYRLTNLRFENGLATALEVITAEEELSTQENQYQQALHDYNLAAVNFDTAIGN